MPFCLVVDDSALVRSIHRHMLERMGFTVMEAGDGEAALAHCTATMPELILLDWNMPILSGIGVLRRLRALPDGRHPKVVLCTMEADLQHIGEAMAEGADEYIMKPFDAHILAGKLNVVGFPVAAPVRSDPLAGGP